MTAMAGRFARNVDANTLVLTHFSGKLEGALYGTSVRFTFSLCYSATRTLSFVTSKTSCA